MDDKSYWNGVEGQNGTITLERLEQKKKTTNIVNYFINETAKTTPEVDDLVQTEYQEADIGT